MADDPLVPPAEPGDPPLAPPAATLAARAAAAAARDLQRAYRLAVGCDAAYWERNLVTGEVWYSPSFFTVIGIDPTTERHSVQGRIHPDDRQAFEAAYQRAIAGVGTLTQDLRYLSHSGEYRWARLQGRVWPDASGQPERVVGIAIDVHEQTLAREELLRHRQGLQQTVDERTARLEAALAEAERQREQAERANAAKSTFLAHMSHEIRTPLKGLLGLNELALREARSDQQRRYLKLALQSGRGLLDMLNGVLDFSRLNAGGAPTRAEAFDLAEALAATMRQVMPQARGKGLGVMFDYFGPVSRVIGDVQRIQQIAANLLTNAVKYTDAGHVALTTTVRPLDDRQCEAELLFNDTGPGMPPEVAARVFEAFVQGDESLARRHGGTGLGLSIARGLAESMGGSLGLQTAPGQGASFRLRLPLHIQPGEQPMEERPQPGLAWLVYTRSIPAQWLATRMDRLGWRSEIVMGLHAAIERATALAAEGGARPDLVVLAEAALADSAELPLLRQLLPHTRTVLLVRPDWNQPRIEAAARASQMPLVFMPLTPIALLDLLAEQGDHLAAPVSAFGDVDSLELDGADVLIAEDNPVNQLIITEMVAALGLRPRLVENGAQAVRACQDQAPRLVLMDLQMPEIDGLEATRQLCELQRSGELERFPIVALTAHATPQDRDRCLAAGMQGYLTKPISLGLLRTELRRWVAV